jgi:uncharacterized membrane protein YjjP (DUF1212 family)
MDPATRIQGTRLHEQAHKSLSGIKRKFEKYAFFCIIIQFAIFAEYLLTFQKPDWIRVLTVP